MKTTPLNEVLKQITPLPYSADSDQITAKDGGLCVADLSECDGQFETREANAAYLTHAANGLPGLVEALEVAARELASRQAVNKVVCERSGIPFMPCAALAQITEALATATNVPVNS